MGVGGGWGWPCSQAHVTKSALWFQTKYLDNLVKQILIYFSKYIYVQLCFVLLFQFKKIFKDFSIFILF